MMKRLEHAERRDYTGELPLHTSSVFIRPASAMIDTSAGTPPEELENYGALLARLRELVRERSARVIGIEGLMAVGKSHLARQLATDLPAGLIETDNFSFSLLYPEQSFDHLRHEPYPNCLDLTALSRSLAEALAKHPVVIVEGICLRDVLARMHQSADLTIYIKCLSHGSLLWHGEYDLEDFEAGHANVRGLHRDELAYHCEARPHEKADLMLIRVETSP